MKSSTPLTITRILPFFCLILFLNLPNPGYSQVYLDSTASVDERVNDLLGRMTLNEKIGQMVQAGRNS